MSLLIFKIDETKDIKIERFKCGLIGCVTSILISNIIVNNVKSDSYFEEGEILSELKSFRIIKESFSKIGQSVLKGIRSIANNVKNLFRKLKSKCKKSKRKKKKLPEEILKSSKKLELKNTEVAS